MKFIHDILSALVSKKLKSQLRRRCVTADNEPTLNIMNTQTHRYIHKCADVGLQDVSNDNI